jgi:hypothetical protein
MKLTLTLLALLVAGVINLQAQEELAAPPTANEAAWDALVVAKSSDWTAITTSPEAAAIKNGIMASGSITEREFRIVDRITPRAEKQAFIRTLAASNKTGEGISIARAWVKLWDKDFTGWTPETIEKFRLTAAQLAVLPEAPLDFKEKVWAVVSSRPAAKPQLSAFFKFYRKDLPLAQQVEVTRQQKVLTLAIPARSGAENAWLAEISADLIALQLDQ